MAALLLAALLRMVDFPQGAEYFWRWPARGTSGLRARRVERGAVIFVENFTALPNLALWTGKPQVPLFAIDPTRYWRVDVIPFDFLLGLGRADPFALEVLLSPSPARLEGRTAEGFELLGVALPHGSLLRVEPPRGRRAFLFLDFSPVRTCGWRPATLQPRGLWVSPDGRRARAWLRLGPAKEAPRAHYALRLEGGVGNVYVLRGRFCEQVCGKFGGRDVSQFRRYGTEKGFSVGGSEGPLFGTSDVAMLVELSGPVEVGLALSFKSAEAAEAYLESEAEGGIEGCERRFVEAWEEVLGRARVRGEERFVRLFYTALHTVYANTRDFSNGESPAFSKFADEFFAVASSSGWGQIQSFCRCLWDNVRATYPFLALFDPPLCRGIVKGYLATLEGAGKYGVCRGHWCDIVAGVGSLSLGRPDFKTGEFFSDLFLMAKMFGVHGVDYSRAYKLVRASYEAAITDGLPGYWERGYVPLRDPSQRTNVPLTVSLELSEALDRLALWAALEGDEEGFRRFRPYRAAYCKLWDPRLKVFRGFDGEGRRFPPDEVAAKQIRDYWHNDFGLFEGSPLAWSFFCPQDPFGLVSLLGREEFVKRLDNYVRTHMHFNDYEIGAPFLAHFAGRPDLAGELVHGLILPKLATLGGCPESFDPWAKVEPGGGNFYSSNAGWILWALMGLYPLQGTDSLLILPPSLDEMVLRRPDGREVRVVARGEGNCVREVRLNGRPFPSLTVAGRVLPGSTLEIVRGDALPERPFVCACVGCVLDARSEGGGLAFTVWWPRGAESEALVACKGRPSSVEAVGGEVVREKFEDGMLYVAVRHLTERVRISVKGG